MKKNNSNSVNNNGIKKANKAKKAATNNKKPYIYNGVTYYSVRETCKAIGIEEKAGTIRNIIREKKIDIQEAIDAYLERHPELKIKVTKATKKTKTINKAKASKTKTKTKKATKAKAAKTPKTPEKPDITTETTETTEIAEAAETASVVTMEPVDIPEELVEAEIKGHPYYAPIECVYHDKKYLSFSAAARTKGLIGGQIDVARRRLKKGMSVDEAIDTPIRAYIPYDVEKGRENLPELIARAIKRGGDVCYDEEGNAYPSFSVQCAGKGVRPDTARRRIKHCHWTTGMFTPAKYGRKTQKYIPFKGKKEISIAYNWVVFDTDINMCKAYPVQDDKLYKKRIEAGWSKRDAMLTPESAGMDETQKPEPAPMAIGFKMDKEMGFRFQYEDGCHVISKKKAKEDKEDKEPKPVKNAYVRAKKARKKKTVKTAVMKQIIDSMTNADKEDISTKSSTVAMTAKKSANKKQK